MKSLSTALVREILQTKGYEVWSVDPGTRVYDALCLMAEKGVGALMVIEAGKLVGIISERDYARKVILKGKSSLNTPVREIMTAEVISVRPEQSVAECMGLMTDKRVRHLPVMTNGQVLGIISIGDVVKEIISEQELYIDDLQHYIEGTGYGR